jgi:hypothetical protein
MLDILCLALVLGFFAIALALMRGCEALEREDDSR